MIDAATIPAMARQLLIAGRNSALIDALVQEGLNLKVRLLTTFDSNLDRPSSLDVPEDAAGSTPWNRRSPLSARSVLLRAVNVLGTLDEAIIVYSSEDKFRPFHELTAAEMEAKIDADVKGYLFIMKEVLAHFMRQRRGTLSLVFQRPSESLGSPLEASSAAAFRSIGDELFAAYQNEPIFLRGFESASDQPREFSQFVMTAAQEKPERSRGKWLRYTGKSGLFSFVR
jgi:NAD(P)-dependent dehydrogenase (short-subunit alcohol dehydrogenase family)